MTQKEFQSLSQSEIDQIINKGGRFVVYHYTISCIYITYRKKSKEFLLTSDEKPIKHGWPYFLLTLLFGWWGIPFGPIFTIPSLYYSIVGEDVKYEILEAMSLEKQQSAPQPQPQPQPQPVVDNNFNFRNIQDVSNVVKYETLDEAINMKFKNYIFNNFKDCQMETRVEVKTVIPTAPDYAMPFNFLLTKGEAKLGIVLVSQGKYKRYSVLETRELCKENNIKMLSFCIERDNTEEYVVDRIRKTLEA